jgi:hypothetical protein
MLNGLVFSGLAATWISPSFADSAGYRTSRIDPRIAQVPADVQQGVFVDPDRHLEPLVRALVAGARDDFHKVKILHDWIAETIAYDVDSYFAGAKSDASVRATLRRRKAVCYGYAALLAEMCSLAGVSCQKISGFGRGYGFASGQEDDPSRTNHAWNAVQIGGRWHLVDVTWDAGHVEKRAFQKKYATTYLFMPPEEFIYTHLPEDPAWQLLRPALSTEQFSDLPYLLGRFFDAGLRLATRLRRVTPAGESVQFAVVVPPEVELMAKLVAPDGQELKRRTLIQSEGEHCRVLVTFPRAGRYTVQLFSRRRGGTGLLWMVASLDFRSSAGTARTFPKTYVTLNKMHGYLESPLYVPLPTGRPVTFKVRLQGTNDVRLAIGERPWLALEPAAGQQSLFQLTTTVPPGERVRLNAKQATGAASYATLIDFTPKDE